MFLLCCLLPFRLLLGSLGLLLLLLRQGGGEGLRFCEFDEVGRHFEELFRGNRIQIEVELHFLAIFLHKELEVLLLCLFIQLSGYFYEVFFVELLHLGLEDLLQNLVNFLEMPHFDHSVGLIDNQILQMFKSEYLVLQQLVQPARSADNDLRLPLGQQPQLLLFRDATDDAGNLELVNRRLVFVYLGEGRSQVAFYLLGQLPGGSEDEGEQAGRQAREAHLLFEQLQLGQQRTGEGESLTRASLGSYQKVVVMRVAVEKFCLDGGWSEQPVGGEGVDELGMQALEVVPAFRVVVVHHYQM